MGAAKKSAAAERSPDWVAGYAAGLVASGGYYSQDHLPPFCDTARSFVARCVTIRAYAPGDVVRIGKSWFVTKAAYRLGRARHSWGS